MPAPWRRGWPPPPRPAPSCPPPTTARCRSSSSRGARRRFRAMDLNKLTHKSQESLAAAQSLAAAASHPEIVPAHLLRALLDQPEGAVYPTLQKVGASPASLRDAADAALSGLPKSYSRDAQPALSPELRSVVEAAEGKATELRDAY